MIEFKKLESGYVEMYEDKRFIGVFPTEKRGRLFANGERDMEGNKVEIISQNITKTVSENILVEVEASNTSEKANQNIGETIKKRRGRRKKVGLNDRRISL